MQQADSLTFYADSLTTSYGDTLISDRASCSELFAGFFYDNPMLHPELPYRSYGMSAMPVSYQLWRDDLVTSLLLVSFLILVYVINKTRRKLIQETRNFFYAPKEHTGLFAVETGLEWQSRVFIILQLCLICGLLVFAYVHQHFNIFSGQVTPRMLLGIYVGSFILYFLLKRILSGFINWIFFPKSQQKLWHDSNSYLISVESILFFPCAIIVIYFDYSYEKSFWMFLFLLFIIKILLAFKTLKIFFPKSYGIFHLFAYLCALELMPLLALWESMAYITYNLIVKY